MQIYGNRYLYYYESRCSVVFVYGDRRCILRLLAMAVPILPVSIEIDALA
jgi:hypothetical protein